MTAADLADRPDAMPRDHFPADASSLAQARWYAARGLCVVWVPRPGGVHNGKVPTIEWGPYQKRRPTDAEIRDWFTTEQNVGVITGAVSGVVVIDADSPAALRWCTSRLPYTPWQTKTAHGFHLWYTHPGVRVANRVRVETDIGRLALDIRGDTGYVIAPGSVHASGVVYQQAGLGRRHDFR